MGSMKKSAGFTSGAGALLGAALLSGCTMQGAGNLKVHEVLFYGSSQDRVAWVYGSLTGGKGSLSLAGQTLELRASDHRSAGDAGQPQRGGPGRLQKQDQQRPAALQRGAAGHDLHRERQPEYRRHLPGDGRGLVPAQRRAGRRKRGAGHGPAGGRPKRRGPTHPQRGHGPQQRAGQLRAPSRSPCCPRTSCPTRRWPRSPHPPRRCGPGSTSSRSRSARHTTTTTTTTEACDWRHVCPVPPQHAAGTPLNFREVASGSNALVSTPQIKLASSQSDLAALWNSAYGRQVPLPPTPLILGQSAVGIFLGSRPTGGYGVTVQSVRASGSALDITVNVRAPAPAASTPSRSPAPGPSWRCRASLPASPCATRPGSCSRPESNGPPGFSHLGWVILRRLNL